MVASWRLFLIVTTTAYTANLVAELTSYKPSVPFRTLGELVDNKDFTFGIHGNGIISSIFKVSGSSAWYSGGIDDTSCKYVLVLAFC